MTAPIAQATYRWQGHRPASDVYLDIETLDLIDRQKPRDEAIRALTLALCCLYDAATGQWHTITLRSIRALPALLYGRRVVGYNIDGFDMPVLRANAERMGVALPADTPTFDIFDIIRKATKRWCKLNDVARATLGASACKTMGGTRAVELLNRQHDREYNWRMVEEYCQHDVQLCIDLHRRIERGEPIIVPSTDRSGQYDIALTVYDEPQIRLL